MPVTSSTVEIGETQPDGRFWVVETHMFDTGAVRRTEYLAPAGLDTQARAAMTAQALDDEEQAELVYVPNSITLVQAHRAVTAAGLRAQVEGVVAQASSEVQDLWYTSETVDRDNPFLNALAGQIWPTDTQANLDNLFRAGSKL